MALQNTYFETKGKDVTTPIPVSPGYVPPDVPTPPTPSEGEMPSIVHPTFAGTTSLVIYNCTAENNIVDKTSYMTQLTSYTIDIKDGTDLLHPVIPLAKQVPDILNANYAMFCGRYYYIIEKTLVKGNLYILHLKEDVLMTFKDQIKTQRGIVARQENKYNLYLDDGMYQVTGQTATKTLKFSGSPLTKGLEYVLMTTGGAVS